MRILPMGAFLAGALLIAGSTGAGGWDFASALRPTPAPPPVRAGAPVSVLTEGADGLARLFATYGFRLGAVPAGKRVPRILVSSLPAGLAAMRPVGRKTKLFRKILLPIVLVVNEAIARDRVRLITLKRKQEIGASLTIEENVFLWSLAREYRVKDVDFDDLLVRVDVIPPSLALAQAIEESGWGTSAYARKGNALFGQEAGLRSANAMAGQIGQRRFKIKAFASLLEAVTAYASNLNTHAAYRGMRALRAAARARGERPDGYRMAGTLLRYSERGPAYVRTIRQLMDGFNLRGLDRARLQGGPGVHVLW